MPSSLSFLVFFVHHSLFRVSFVSLLVSPVRYRRLFVAESHVVSCSWSSLTLCFPPGMPPFTPANQSSRDDTPPPPQTRDERAEARAQQVEAVKAQQEADAREKMVRERGRKARMAKEVNDVAAASQLAAEAALAAIEAVEPAALEAVVPPAAPTTAPLDAVSWDEPLFTGGDDGHSVSPRAPRSRLPMVG